MSTQKSDNGPFCNEKMKVLSEGRESDLVISELRMNLTTLQKFDQYISSVICTCKRVAQYQFSTQDHRWVDKKLQLINFRLKFDSSIKICNY